MQHSSAKGLREWRLTPVVGRSVSAAIWGRAPPSQALLGYLTDNRESEASNSKPSDSVDLGDLPLELPAEFPQPVDTVTEDQGFRLPDEATAATPLQTRDMGVTTEEEIDAIQVPVLGRLRVSQLGLPLFTFLIGLADGFNPCAMWVLVFLLSVLVNIKDRRKILVVAGTFVVVSGLAYFAFMAAWFSVFQLIGFLRPVQIGLGGLAILIGIVNIKDFFYFHQGLSFSIPDAAKPGIYRRVREIVSANYLTTALVGATVLAVVVNIVELLCTAGLPALYTEILSLQQLSTMMNYAYLGLYIVAYMLDDTILVAIVVTTMSRRRLQEGEGRWLKLASGTIILLLGGVMIFQPNLLV